VELAKRRGIAAIVTDGLLRDCEEIGGADIAVSGGGPHPSSPRDDTQGRIGMPVLLQGAKIETGEVAVEDADGIAIIPSAAVPAVLEALLKQQQSAKIVATSGGISSWRISSMMCSTPACCSVSCCRFVICAGSNAGGAGQARASLDYV
jgi:4-hydroxy-4-methyl-2-oxoglutarate aldolase